MALSDYDNEYDPTKGPQILPSIDSLPDGVYTFAIVRSEHKVVDAGDLVELSLLIKETGQKVAHTYWLNHPVKVDIFGRDCCTLGFQQHMGKGCKPSMGVPIVAKKLAGISFRGEKRMQHNKKDGKEYAQLMVHSRLDGGTPIADPDFY